MLVLYCLIYHSVLINDSSMTQHSCHLLIQLTITSINTYAFHNNLILVSHLLYDFLELCYCLIVFDFKNVACMPHYVHNHSVLANTLLSYVCVNNMESIVRDDWAWAFCIDSFLCIVATVISYNCFLLLYLLLFSSYLFLGFSFSSMLAASFFFLFFSDFFYHKLR